MSDYRKMYHTLFEACTQAIEVLIAAQQKCEEIYIDEPMQILLIPEKDKKADKNSLNCCADKEGEA